MFPGSVLATLNWMSRDWGLLEGTKNPQSVPKAHLEVFGAELVAVHVDSGQEDGLHLVVPKLVGGEVRGDQDLQTGGREDRDGRSWEEGEPQTQPYAQTQTDLPGSESHLAVLAPAQLRELVEDGGQLVGQGGVWAAQLILQGQQQNPS